MKISIIIPCLNEEKTIGACVKEAKRSLGSLDLAGEVIVVDNGSTDRSAVIATEFGARLIRTSRPGYGAALKAGLLAAQGEFVIMGDGDGSYDFTEVSRFMKKFDDGYDLVIGNRFQGGIEPKAMPFLNRYVGNPLLTKIIRVFYGNVFGDTQCGLRGGKRSALLTLNLASDQFEFASEMVVKALRSSFRLAEVPVRLRYNNPARRSHLRPFRDGLRHLWLIVEERFR